MYKICLLLLSSVIILNTANAQNKKKKKNEIKVTGAVESNSQYYNEKDDKLGFIAPTNRFRSNNYLKLNTTYKGFSAGIQYEAYEPDVLLGYPENLKGNGITNYYIAYASKKISATVGHFYEQFGSGLVLRSWEDRQLGINNALRGAKIQFTPSDAISIKAIYGQKRDAYTVGEGKVWGADAELNLTKLFKQNELQKGNFTAGLSYVGKQEEYTGNITGYPENVQLFSLRSGYQKNNIILNAEYALRTKDGCVNDLGNVINSTRFFSGNVLQLGATITGKNSALNVTLRQAKNFAMYTDRRAKLNQLLLNYVPALTKQHHYALTNIYVYNPQVRFSFLPGNILNNTGEIGGQVEWLKTFPKKSKLGGKHGLFVKIHLSNYAGLAFDGTDINTAKIYNFKANKTNFRDFNIEVKKTWNAKVKTVFSYINILYNQKAIEGFGSENVSSNILVAEGIFKLKKGHSIRTDIQHLWAKNDYRGNWVAATVEYGIAPMLNFFVTDMYNYGNAVKKVHYYNAGASFTKGTARVMVSYGRQREGLLCVGGVCRLVPASSGFTISTSFSF